MWSYLCKWKIRADLKEIQSFICEMTVAQGSEVQARWIDVTVKDIPLCVSQTQTQQGVWEWPRLNAWHKGISCNWTSGPENLSVRLSGKSLTWKDNPLLCPVFVNHIKLLWQLAPWFQSWCVSRIIHLSQGPVVHSVTCWSVGLWPEMGGANRKLTVWVYHLWHGGS